MSAHNSFSLSLSLKKKHRNILGACVQRIFTGDQKLAPPVHAAPLVATHRIWRQHVDPSLGTFRQQQSHEREVSADASRGKPNSSMGDILGRGRQTRRSSNRRAGFAAMVQTHHDLRPERSLTLVATIGTLGSALGPASR